MSAILSQPNKDGDLQPVSYFSRKLMAAERLWQVHDQELGAIVTSFEEWRAWLVGTSILIAVFSDHANLRYFMASQKLTPRQACWASYLSSFFFNILHTPGKLNPVDPASRRPDYESSASLTEPVKLFFTHTLPNGLNMATMQTSTSSVDISFSLPGNETCQILLTSYNMEKAFLTDNPGPLYNFKGSLWWFRNHLYVPASLHPTLLSHFHDSPSMGHPGTACMLAILSWTYSWPTIRKDVILFVKSCDSCQQTKIDTSRKTGKLLPFPYPDQPWHHGFLDKIVSDRGATFVSAFWTAIQTKLWIQPAPSTSFHPQTDGQTERTNQTLETYLRHFVSYRQDNWSEWLAMAEFTFNNSPNSSTKLSPFFSWQGFHPQANSFTAPSQVPSADLFVELLEDIQLLLLSSLKNAKLSQAHAYNKHSKPSPTYHPGDLVWSAGWTGPAPSAATKSIPIHPWHHVAQVLDYCTWGHRHPEYLLHWLHGSPSDDTWVPLTDISKDLNPFLLTFHA
ncbi:hypothetical protein CROQUDRAFT_95671 [Cronartium quercuum f. sp. fusiforme G11]|uniref:Integrase catalytic domain-containing protein n=1 Tax=Cronartium quercuum f. sp. fusiforme G11 TaxID=708437 RepID=A0A9P6ND43_9BASI|nr:hypothetical protein CROQUDRAFT_95671 [Cronartium quercuum f. sp. fusiforme G11]